MLSVYVAITALAGGRDPRSLFPWKRRVRPKVPARLAFSEALSSATFLLCLLCGCPWSLSYNSTSHVGFGPHITPHLSLITSLEALSPNTVTLSMDVRVRVREGDGRWEDGRCWTCPALRIHQETQQASSDACLYRFLFFHEVSKSVSTAEQQLWKKSFSCFEKGIHNFESIDDATNAALLLCNTGRLMRICAQAHCGAGDEFKREFSPEEGLYYNKVTHLLMFHPFIHNCHLPLLH